MFGEFTFLEQNITVGNVRHGIDPKIDRVVQIIIRANIATSLSITCICQIYTTKATVTLISFV